jgi:glycerophosphoryl diester phosphodiesterase
MLEMDVIETKDGVLVVHHDKDLMRTCGVEKEVGEFNRDELPPFQNEVLMHFTSEQLKLQWKGETIPTL